MRRVFNLAWLSKTNNQSPKTSRSQKLRNTLVQGSPEPKNYIEITCWVVASLFLAIMLWQTVHKGISIYNIEQQILQVQQQIEDSKLEYSRLQQQRDFMQTDAYIEREVRETLRLLKDGDLFLVIP